MPKMAKRDIVSPVESLKEFLRAMRTVRAQAFENLTPKPAYMGVEDFLLQHGHALPAGRFRSYGEMGACYRNAFMATIHHPEWRYAEGYALSSLGVPVEHAWCVDDRGRVVEVTWSDGLAYCGVQFENEYIQDRIVESGYAAPALFDWEGGWPILTDPEVRNEVVLEIKEAAA
jgi:hypothetical protein